MIESMPSPKPQLHELTPEQRNETRFAHEGTMMRKIHTPLAVAFIGLEPIMRQLGSAEVADAVHKWQFIEQNPFRRLANTFNSGVDMIHGTHGESLRVSERISGIHRGVRSRLPEGTRYSAEDPELLKWVAATLVEGSVVGYEMFVGELTDLEKDQYVKEAGPFFYDVGLPMESLPQTYKELQGYLQDAIDRGKVEVSDSAKLLLPYATLSNRFPTEVLMSYMKLTLLYTLPEKLRRQYGLQKLTPGQRKFFELSASFFRKIGPHLPTLRSYYQFRRRLGIVAKYES